MQGCFNNKRDRLPSVGNHQVRVMLTHGFRKFAITETGQSRFSRQGIFGSHRHTRGLDNEYVRDEVDELLLEWSKAINKLTINSEFHLTKELEIAKGETDQKIAQMDTHIKDLEDRLRRAGLWDSCD
jgi:hypothetical protein